MRHLGARKLGRARRVALVQMLGWLGLALALDNADEPSAEERMLREVALPATVGRYGDCLQVYAEEREAAGAPPVDELIERLGGARLIERIRTQRPIEERYPTSVARLSALVRASAAPTLVESIDLLLDRISLSRSDGSETDEQRINLLTLHSTKGLEFSRVYIVGAEDASLPGLVSLSEERRGRAAGGATPALRRDDPGQGPARFSPGWSTAAAARRAGSASCARRGSAPSGSDPRPAPLGLHTPPA